MFFSLTYELGLTIYKPKKLPNKFLNFFVNINKKTEKKWLPKDPKKFSFDRWTGILFCIWYK